MDDILRLFRAKLTGFQGGLKDDAVTLDIASRDASLFKVRPKLVALPFDAADIGRLVRTVSEIKKNNPEGDISLTARSAGTDMSGGPLNSSIIMDMTAHFNKIHEVGEGYAITDPGVYFRDFDAETQKSGQELPSYTASRSLNTVGGMVANDSGGEKNLRFGKTAKWVREIEVVLADGEVHTLRNLEGGELKSKLSEDGFEGDCYRKMADLVKSNRALIEGMRPEVSKNSAGYALWDIGDGENSLNLARLFTGSQGTLGIATKIKFGLIHPETHRALVVLFLDDFDVLGELIPEVLAHNPDSFESYDDATFKLAFKYWPEFAKKLGRNVLSVGFSFLPEAWMALTGGIPKMVLLVEFRSDTEGHAQARAAKFMQEFSTHENYKGKLTARLCKTEAEAQKWWTIRRESFALLRNKLRGQRTAPFIDDFVVLPSKLPEFFPRLRKLLSEYDIFMTVAGHVGDGNFHIIPLVDPKREDIPHIIDELGRRAYELVLEFGGSITGEHNDGLIRTPYLAQQFGVDAVKLFGEVKKIFDPLNIFNPGKKVGTTWEEAKQKLDLGG
jgi:FAD/FMN-containing dehydrogenase